MDTDLKNIQSKLLELMKIFHKVCVRNSITYYMLGGTLLGALRHQGFIPWDDDIDVGLPRHEYERFLSLPKYEWPSNIWLKTAENSNDVLFPYSKLMNVNTTVVEKVYSREVIGGVFIDIFPLDGLGNSELLLKLRYYKLYYHKLLLYFNQGLSSKGKGLKGFIEKIIWKKANSKDLKVIYQTFINKQKLYNYNQSKFVGNLAGVYGHKEIVPKKYFGNPKLYKFEDSHFYGPQKAEDYLCAIYGDYLKLPDLEHRKPHHNYIYINLDLPFIKYNRTNN